MSLHIAIIWQRFLPYHWARFEHARQRLKKSGHRLTAIEVAIGDDSYGFPEYRPEKPEEYVCCFPGASYHNHRAQEIYERVLNVLTDLGPDIVFCPATAFPEGMAAVAYRLASGGRVVIMDDAWEHTDQKGFLTNKVKFLIHKNIDAAFVPAPSHVPYYVRLGFPQERLIFGVDVVDNDYFMKMAEKVRADDQAIRAKHALPLSYFLFVGRFLPSKGIECLITAYQKYREKEETPWDLVLVGSGRHMETIRKSSEDIPGIHLAGPRFGDNLCLYYSLAQALIVPSLRDPWGLVINEGMASGLPLLASRGCGAAQTLIQEGENGWTFEPEDVDSLTDLMCRIASIPQDIRRDMGQKSKEIIAFWSLDRFAEGVSEAIKIPRRLPAGYLSTMLAKLWKGRVSIK